MREESLVLQIEGLIDIVKCENRKFHVHRNLNASSHLVFCGFHNHRDERIIEFFKAVGRKQPWSYGKLHIRDDEDARGYQNAMREWTMALGRVTEDTDQRMSPCIPAIEPEIQ